MMSLALLRPMWHDLDILSVGPPGADWTPDFAGLSLSFLANGKASRGSD
jgi:hypothetical protein